MVAAKAIIQTHGDYSPVVPILIPDLEEARALATKLHAIGKAWKGEAFGWSAEYNPELPEAPDDRNILAKAD